MKIRMLLSALLIALLPLVQTIPARAVPTPVLIALGSPTMYATEAAAQAHCPRDIVVWLNIPTGIYHEKGMRWYGRTKHGAFVCKKEADAVGDRDTRNGQ